MMMRALICGLAAAVLLVQPAMAQARRVAVTFDDLPFQTTDEVLCDPARLMKMTEDFVAMLKPLETRGAAFVNEGKVCEAQRSRLLPEVLNGRLCPGQ